MSEPMSTYLEIWPLAADEVGIWLLSGDDAWRPRLPVMGDSQPHWDVELELASHGVKDEVRLLHSTSWRAERSWLTLTYAAVIDAGEAVPERWPQALPVNPLLAETAGPAPSVPATHPPQPRYVDVLLHAVRHLRFLSAYDSTAAEAMPHTWRRHLTALTPELARMYSAPYRSEQ
jgi:hypothetical protein